MPQGQTSASTSLGKPPFACIQAVTTSVRYEHKVKVWVTTHKCWGHLGTTFGAAIVVIICRDLSDLCIG